MAAGAFADLSSQVVVRQLGQLAEGPRGLGAYGGKTYGVPYYAGSRVVTYRTDLFKKAGITKLPATTARVRGRREEAAGEEREEGLLAGLHRRHRLVRRDGLRLRLRRRHRARRSAASGRACSTRRKSIAGLTAYKNFFLATSRASKTTDETHPNPYDVYAQGQAASIVGPSWFSCCVGESTRASTAQFVMPGHVKGQAMPGFLGGSDLAVPGRRAPTRRSPPTGSRTSRARVARRRCRRRATSRTRPTCSARASTSGLPHAAGSSRRRSTGSTSRTATSSATCWRRSSPASCRSSRQLPPPSDNIASVLNQS